jgi:hypothetical protein
MNYRNLIYATTIFSILVVWALYSIVQNPEQKIYSVTITSDKITKSAPPCLQMYDAIMKYADTYDIPKKYAFGIAWAETRYGGPFHWKYKHTQTSCAGAIGPMQIMPSTARLMWKGQDIDNKKLMSDIDFNVHTSMKLLRKLYDKYRDWKIVFGCYNTGKPMINDYAIKVFNHEPKWFIK